MLDPERKRLHDIAVVDQMEAKLAGMVEQVEEQRARGVEIMPELDAAIAGNTKRLAEVRQLLKREEAE